MTNKEKHMKLLEIAIDRGLNYYYQENINASVISDPSRGCAHVTSFYDDWPPGSSGGFDAAVKRIEEYKS